MSEFVDPLEQLKASYSQDDFSQLKVCQQGQSLIFSDGIKFPMKTVTAWFSPVTKKQYNLGSLWLLLEYNRKKQSKSEYFDRISKEKMQHVNIADQSQIIAYFTGNIETTSCINKQIKLDFYKNIKIEEENIEEKNSCQIKVEKMDDETSFQLQVMKYLSKHEAPISTRSKCLKHPKLSFKKILTDINEKQKEMNNRKIQIKKPRISYFYQRKRRPLIVVPQKIQIGNVSIHNIQKFLLQNIFDGQMRYENPHISKIDFRKTMRNHSIIFEVINNAQCLKPQDWEYVVAIFVTGCSSQFEGWIRGYRKILDRIKGYFIKYYGSLVKCHESINVKQFLLDEKSRNEDRRYSQLIWQDIEQHLFERISQNKRLGI